MQSGKIHLTRWENPPCSKVEIFHLQSGIFHLQSGHIGPSFKVGISTTSGGNIPPKRVGFSTM